MSEAPRMIGAEAGPEALASGEAFADLTSWRAIGVGGTEAFDWLNDLVSADLAGLQPGVGRRSLLLSPTGSVRASFQVTLLGEDLLLLQDPAEPEPIDRALTPYVLSSDVRVTDRTGEVARFAFPGTKHPPDTRGMETVRPSALGTGIDVVAPAEDRDRLMASMGHSLAGADGLESWRVAAGIPRVGVDIFEGDLPQESRLEPLVSWDKGCFLGQEAVAKARNLGRPRRSLVTLETDGLVVPGDRVLSDDREAGAITSVGVFAGRTVAIARIRWALRGGLLRTETGSSLTPRDPV